MREEKERETKKRVVVWEKVGERLATENFTPPIAVPCP